VRREDGHGGLQEVSHDKLHFQQGKLLGWLDEGLADGVVAVVAVEVVVEVEGWGGAEDVELAGGVEHEADGLVVAVAVAVVDGLVGVAEVEAEVVAHGLVGVAHVVSVWLSSFG
jgi:hypothetical protein